MAVLRPAIDALAEFADIARVPVASTFVFNIGVIFQVPGVLWA